MKSLKVKKYEGIESLRLDVERYFNNKSFILCINKKDKEKFELEMEKYPGIFNWSEDQSYIKGPNKTIAYLL